MEAIHSGWLVKSPPEKKLRRGKGQWIAKLFHFKWRRRFFVLRVPPGSLPGSYQLAYFDGPGQRKRLGTIDLDVCEEVLIDLESPHYGHLFALKTKHKHRNRTYYLAADNQQDMMKWVECLCRVCGFKQDPDAVISTWPPTTAPMPAASTGPTVSSSHIQASPTAVTRATATVVQASSQISQNTTGSDESKESYIQLFDFFSDPSKLPPGTRSPLDVVPPAPSDELRTRRNSIPEMPAPPPPVKTGEAMNPAQYDPSLQTTYDSPSKSYINLEAFPPKETFYKVPPSQQFEDDGVYKVPGRLEPFRANNDVDDDGEYKVPPSWPVTTTSNSLYQVPPTTVRAPLPAQAESTYNVPQSYWNKVPPTRHMQFKTQSDDFYSVPPNRKRLSMEYDIPGSNQPLQAQRNSNSSSESKTSHKPDSAYGSKETVQEHVSRSVDTQSMEHLSNRLTAQQLHAMEYYDIPPMQPLKTQSETNILNTVPPPPRPRKTEAPAGPYINLPQNSRTSQQTSLASKVLPPEPKISPIRKQPPPVFEDDTYDYPRPTSSGNEELLSMSPPPPPPCNVTMHPYINAPAGTVTTSASTSNATTESMYLPMHGEPEVYLPMQNSSVPSLYADMSEGLPPPSNAMATNAPTSAAGGRSPPKLTRLQMQSPTALNMPGIYSTDRTKSFKRQLDRENPDIALPTRRPGSHDSISSSDEDESCESHDQSFDTFEPQNRADLQSKPPPPNSMNQIQSSPKSNKQVQYLELDLNDSNEGEKSPGSIRSYQPSQLSPVDYKEIDFVKTKALSETIRSVESKRKSSDKSIDE